MREKYPATRVDLTELFSNNLIRRGHCIDWLLQSNVEKYVRIKNISTQERFFIGSAGQSTNIRGKILNQCRGFIHDTKIWHLTRRNHYDFIQVRDKIFASLIALITAKANKLPFFYWMSYPFPENDLYRVTEFGHSISLSHRCFYKCRGLVTAWLLYTVILPKADHVFVQSERMLDSVTSRGINPDKMTAVPMGVNLARIDEVTLPLMHDARLFDRLPVVYTGTLTTIRKMGFLLQVFHQVHAEIPQALLVLVGGALDKDMQCLYDEVDRLKLRNHVVFTGVLPLAGTWNYIRSAKVCVSPIPPGPVLDLGSPTKVVEYLAWNRPVVANDHPEQGQMIRASEAGIVVPYQIAPFTDAIIELLKDEKIAQGMASKGRVYVQAHRSYTAIAANLESVYSSILSRYSEPKQT